MRASLTPLPAVACSYINIDGFVLHNIVATGTADANMGTQSQLCFHVRELRHSSQTCMPFMFYQGDDGFTPLSIHGAQPLPNDPTKYARVLDAVKDKCHSPFELTDGRLVTFCGPHVPDYKAAGKLGGLGGGPRSTYPSVLDRAKNELMGRAPEAL